MRQHPAEAITLKSVGAMAPHGPDQDPSRRKCAITDGAECPVTVGAGFPP